MKAVILLCLLNDIPYRKPNYIGREEAVIQDKWLQFECGVFNGCQWGRPVTMNNQQFYRCLYFKEEYEAANQNLSYPRPLPHIRPQGVIYMMGFLIHGFSLQCDLNVRFNCITLQSLSQLLSPECIQLCISLWHDAWSQGGKGVVDGWNPPQGNTHTHTHTFVLL